MGQICGTSSVAAQPVPLNPLIHQDFRFDMPVRCSAVVFASRVNSGFKCLARAVDRMIIGSAVVFTCPGNLTNQARAVTYQSSHHITLSCSHMTVTCAIPIIGMDQSASCFWSPVVFARGNLRDQRSVICAIIWGEADFDRLSRNFRTSDSSPASL